MGPFKDIGVQKTGHVTLVEIRRPPHNFFDVALIKELASAFEALDADAECRALVLAAQGKAFCAGADFGGDDSDGSALLSGPTPGAAHLYIEGNRLFRTKKPIVAAVHGAAVGGGLGLAMVGDLRVTCPEARFCANFTRLGFHPGFGLTVTLPAVIGPSKAALMFYTSRRVSGEEAFAQAGLKPQDVDTVQLYDSFTITAMLMLEDLGFCKKGEGGPFAASGALELGGSLPMNTDGGALSSCHPGMRGIFLLIEATRQLRGQAGEAQVAGAEVALACGSGGTLSAMGTVILGKERK